MALDTYDDLNTSLQDWLMRVGEAELVAKIPELIALAEEEFRDRVRIRELKTLKEDSHTTKLVTLPDDYLEMVSGSVKIVHESGKETPVFPMSELQMTDRSGVTGSYARYYDILGKQLEFRPEPSSDSKANYRFRYHAADAALTQQNQSNEILKAYPSLYLWGSLVKSAMYVRSPTIQSWFPTWEKEFEKTIARANAAGRAGEHAGPIQGNPPR